MHPANKYTNEEADHVFAAVRGFRFHDEACRPLRRERRPEGLGGDPLYSHEPLAGSYTGLGQRRRPC